MEAVNYPKRNLLRGQEIINHLLKGHETQLGKNRAGKAVLICDGKAIAVSDKAFETLSGDSVEGLQYFEFQVGDAWIPCICKAGGLENAHVHTW